MSATISDTCVCSPSGRCCSHGEMVIPVLHDMANRLTEAREDLGLADRALDQMLLDYEAAQDLDYTAADKLLQLLGPKLADLREQHWDRMNTGLINNNVDRYLRMERAKTLPQPA